MLEHRRLEDRTFERRPGLKIWKETTQEGILMCDCGSLNFLIRQPQSKRQNETIAKCSWCSIEEVVHET